LELAQWLATASLPLLLILGTISLVLITCELSVRLRRQAGRWGSPTDQKAVTLLREWLSPAQLAQFENKGCFDVTGCHSGKRYRIRRGRQANIGELDARGALVATWCFGPEGNLAIGDIMLAQKISLETNEAAALAVANRLDRAFG
jgi:hypothetical protein